MQRAATELLIHGVTEQILRRAWTMEYEEEEDICLHCVAKEVAEDNASKLTRDLLAIFRGDPAEFPQDYIRDSLDFRQAAIAATEQVAEIIHSFTDEDLANA